VAADDLDSEDAQMDKTGKMGSSFWPLFELELRTSRLVLRPPRDEDFEGLLQAIDEGIHAPESMPFSQPWTDAEPTAKRQRRAVLVESPVVL